MGFDDTSTLDITCAPGARRPPAGLVAGGRRRRHCIPPGAACPVGPWAAAVARHPSGVAMPRDWTSPLWAQRPHSARSAAVAGVPPAVGSAPADAVVRAGGPAEFTRPPRMSNEVAAAARAVAAPCTWGDPLGAPALPIPPIPPAVGAAGFVAACESCWPRILSLVGLANPGDGIGAEEVYTAFESRMEFRGHKAQGVDTVTRFLSEYGGTFPSS